MSQPRPSPSRARRTGSVGVAPTGGCPSGSSDLLGLDVIDPRIGTNPADDDAGSANTPRESPQPPPNHQPYEGRDAAVGATPDPSGRLRRTAACLTPPRERMPETRPRGPPRCCRRMRSAPAPGGTHKCVSPRRAGLAPGEPLAIPSDLRACKIAKVVVGKIVVPEAKHDVALIPGRRGQERGQTSAAKPARPLPVFVAREVCDANRRSRSVLLGTPEVPGGMRATEDRKCGAGNIRSRLGADSVPTERFTYGGKVGARPVVVSEQVVGADAESAQSSLTVGRPEVRDARKSNPNADTARAGSGSPTGRPA